MKVIKLNENMTDWLDGLADEFLDEYKDLRAKRADFIDRKDYSVNKARKILFGALKNPNEFEEGEIEACKKFISKMQQIRWDLGDSNQKFKESLNESVSSFKDFLTSIEEATTEDEMLNILERFDTIPANYIISREQYRTFMKAWGDKIKQIRQSNIYEGLKMKFKRLNEKLIPASQDLLDKFEEILAKNGWDIEGKGKTWMGNIHYQIICDGHPIHPEDLRQLATPLINDIHSFEEDNNIPITWNFGLNKDSIPTAGVTLDSQWVPDGVNESLLKESYGDGWSEDVKDLLENLVDELYHFSYEIQSCVRGAYTNCDTSEELGDYMISLSELIASLGESVKELPSAEDYGDDEDLDESLNSSSINDIEPINK